MPEIPEKSNILIRLWECDIFADNAIYKRHFVDANSVHWLDPTHNVFGLGLTTYIHILDEEEKRPWKKGASNELQQKKESRVFKRKEGYEWN